MLTLIALPVLVTLAAADPAPPAKAAPPAVAPDPMAFLKRYDALMAPTYFTAKMIMTAHRPDGTARTYEMDVQKSGFNLLRASLQAPATAKGQEILRNGDNLYSYVPNLKRAVRVASRDSFMGGDFSNGDVMRVNYEADYTATLGTDPTGKLVVLELKAKGPEVTYDAIRLFMTSGKDPQPVRAEYFASSGKLLRSAEFSDVKDFGHGLVRPSKVVMKNELEKSRYSELSWAELVVKETLPAGRFTVEDLGR